MSIGQPAPFPGQSDKIVQVENLSKKYGENVAVTWRAAPMVTVQVSPEALSQPLHETDWSIECAAVSVTVVPPE